MRRGGRSGRTHPENVVPKSTPTIKRSLIGGCSLVGSRTGPFIASVELAVALLVKKLRLSWLRRLTFGRRGSARLTLLLLGTLWLCIVSIYICCICRGGDKVCNAVCRLRQRQVRMQAAAKPVFDYPKCPCSVCTVSRRQSPNLGKARYWLIGVVVMH